MAAVRAGGLRTLVIVQKDTGTARSAQGDVTPSWVTHVKRWCRVVPLSGREPFEAGQKYSETRFRFETRHMPKAGDPGKTTSDPRMRILWGARTFDIVAVIDVEERRRETHMTAIERTT